MITYTIYCMRQVLRLLQTQELDRTIYDYPLPVALSYMISHAILILVHPYIYIDIYITCDKYITSHTITNGTNTNCIYHYSVVVLVMTQQYTRSYNLYQLIYIYICIYIIYGYISTPYITVVTIQVLGIQIYMLGIPIQQVASHLIHTGTFIQQLVRARYTRIHARYTHIHARYTYILVSICEAYTHSTYTYTQRQHR